MGGDTVVGGDLDAGRHHVLRARGREHPPRLRRRHVHDREHEHGDELGRHEHAATTRSTSRRSPATRPSSTGAGNDTIHVTNAGLVARIAGLLTIDAGADVDHLIVDDSQNPNATTGTLTGSTLTGLGMPTVAEEQTLDVAAASGTYELLAAGYGSITVSATASTTELETALNHLFGITGVHVDLISSTATGNSYRILFAGRRPGCTSRSSSGYATGS